jgi:hypothetical protein
MSQCVVKICPSSPRATQFRNESEQRVVDAASPTLLESSAGCSRKPIFGFGKLVTVDAPRSADECWQEFKGQQGTVKSLKRCSVEGFVYALQFESKIPSGALRELLDVPERFLKKAGILARSSNVQPLTLGALLTAAPHRIPVFQRRYCWSKSQCLGLWRSIVDVRDDEKLNAHSLGRIMLFQHKDGSRLVLDGQQRLTTTLLLITALRHRMEALGEDVRALTRLTANDRFLPTMDDRADFRRCLFDPNATGDSSLLQAAKVFAELVGDLDVTRCQATANATLSRLSALAFTIDSPEALQSVFEGMARKSQLTEQFKGTEHDLGSCAACFASGDGGRVVASTHVGPDGNRMCQACAATTPGAQPLTPGMPMVPLDLLRNFVCDHFASEERMVEAHAAHWRPLEVMFDHDIQALEDALEVFVDEKGFPMSSRWSLYGSFTAWWREADEDLADEGVEAKSVAKLRILRNALQAEL